MIFTGFLVNWWAQGECTWSLGSRELARAWWSGSEHAFGVVWNHNPGLLHPFCPLRVSEEGSTHEQWEVRSGVISHCLCSVKKETTLSWPYMCIYGCEHKNVLPQVLLQIRGAFSVSFPWASSRFILVACIHVWEIKIHNTTFAELRAVSSEVLVRPSQR